MEDLYSGAYIERTQIKIIQKKPLTFLDSSQYQTMNTTFTTEDL